MRTAVRSLARRPALSATIVVTLALGIGANAAIFSAIDAVLLEPLPYPDAGRLVKLYELNLGARGATPLVLAAVAAAAAILPARRAVRVDPVDALR